MAKRPSWWPSSPYERNIFLSEAFEIILILGLAVELVFVFVLDKSLLEKVETGISDIMIFGGVLGAFHFGRKARVIGETEQAQANERASKADQKAMEAQLELAKFRATRSLTPEQQRQLAARLVPFPGTPCVVFVQLSSDPMSLHASIDAALRLAGWVPTWPSPPAPTANLASKRVGMAFSRGTQVGYDGRDERIAPVAHALSTALAEIGVANELDDKETGFPNAVVLQIGEKE